jgi:hypothetical protein
MSQNSVTEYLSFLNHQIISQEALLEYHLKAGAMLKVLLESNLHQYSYVTIHYYLDGLSDIISQAKDLNESLLNALIKIASLLEPYRGSSGGRGAAH